jgi:hypothetical protein
MRIMWMKIIQKRNLILKKFIIVYEEFSYNRQ